MNCRATCFLKPDSSLANENGKPQNESSVLNGLICLSVMLANKVTCPHHHLPSLAIAIACHHLLAPLGLAEIFFIAVVFRALSGSNSPTIPYFRFPDIYNGKIILPACC